MSPHLLLIFVLSCCSLVIVLIISIRQRKALLLHALPSALLNEAQRQELIDLIKRYRFFAGNNLDRCQTLLEQADFKGLELLITEKFQAQQKHRPKLLAKTTLHKLVAIVGGQELNIAKLQN